jgi:hypothetical protein
MEFLQPYQSHILVGLVIVALLQFILIWSTQGRLSRLNRMVRQMLTGPTGEDLEAMLKRCLDESKRSLQYTDDLDERLKEVSQTMRGCVQNVGLVRYDAYGDVSGSQSFSVALLDDHHNGVIISGLLGRNDGRCYGKSVLNGHTEQTLSDEEASALHIALNGGIGSGADSTPPDRSERRARREKGLLNRA